MAGLKGKVTLLLLIVVMLVVTACSGNGGQNESNKETQNNDTSTPTTEPVVDLSGRYAETVTVGTIMMANAEEKYPEGESAESNKYKTFMEDTLNIKIEFLWSAPAGDSYINKFNLMIASDDLPDIFTVEDQGQVPAKVILNRLVQNGMIEDLTDVYDKYASDKVKDINNAIDGSALAEATYDGKLMAIPSVSDTAASTPLVWVRQDWLDKLGLPAPDSLENLIKVAKGFKEGDPNGNNKQDELGLAINKDLFADGSPFNVDSIFWSNQSFPKFWMKNDSGQLEYGGIQSETKEMLGFLNDLFEQGLIEKDFPLKGGNELTPTIGASTSGLLLGQWWNPFWPLGDAWLNDPNADWKAYTLKDAAGITNVGSNYRTNKFLVVRKGYSNPEAAMKIINYFKEYHPEVTELDTGLYAGDFARQKYGVGFKLDYQDTVLRSVVKFRDVLAGKAQPESLDIDEQSLYEQLKRNATREESGVKFDESTLGDLQASTAWLIALGAATDAKLETYYNQFSGTTPTMDTNWTALTDLQIKSYYQIIMGEKELDYFETFVELWKQQGGEKITQEVNETYNSQQ